MSTTTSPRVAMAESTASPDLESATYYVTDTVGTLCVVDCDPTVHKDAAVGLLIGGGLTLLILACVVLYVYVSVKRKPKTLPMSENGEREEVLQNWANSIKRKVKGIANLAYVDQEASHPVTSLESSVQNSLDLETAITLYSEDNSDVCVWGLATSDLVASTVNPSTATPMCIHNGILPTPAPPIVDGHASVDRAVRPSSLDVRPTVPEQSENVLAEDATPPVRGVLYLNFAEPAVGGDIVQRSNAEVVCENDYATELTEVQSGEIVAASENDTAATEDNSSIHQAVLCNDDSDTSGIHSADRSDTDDATKTLPNACAGVAATDASAVAIPVTSCAGTAGNEADDELSEIDDVDLTGVVVNSSFDSTDNTLDVNDVIVDREARQITIGSVSLNFNVGGAGVEGSPDGTSRQVPVTGQGDAAT